MDKELPGEVMTRRKQVNAKYGQRAMAVPLNAIPLHTRSVTTNGNWMEASLDSQSFHYG